MKFETKAIRVGQKIDPTTGAVIVPIYQSTTYAFHSVGEPRSFEYTRSGNPTRHAYETCLASLECGKHAVTYSSGMAATDAALSLLQPGEHVVSCSNIYGGTLRLFESVYKKRGIEFTYVKGDNPADFAAAMKPNTRMVWLETPANPTLELLDIEAISAATRSDKIQVLVDNTFCSPYLQNPLKLGATLVLQSTTKYIGGHSDLVGGAVITNDDETAEALRFYQFTVGAVPSAFDCYLALRGMKTLSLRMKQHCENALAVARFLRQHPKVDRVYYPGLEEHPSHELAKRQMRHFGGMVTFVAKTDRAGLNRMIDGITCFFFAESLGGVESLICHPPTMSHAVLSEEQRMEMGIPDNMLRLSVGIEHIDDLLEDLAKALDRI
ncbi:MAG: trans-sulfuration enzyme family protein [Sumerlaeia bacterium]